MLSTPSLSALTFFLRWPQFQAAKMKRFKFLLFAAVLAGFTALAYAGFDDGKATYDRGDFATAYKEFKLLAEQWDAEDNIIREGLVPP